MSYSSPQNGPGGAKYWHDDDYGIPAYHEQDSSRHQQPSRARPSQQQQQQPYHQPADPRMRFPRPQAPRAPPPQKMEPSRNLYDGSDYGEPEQDQWPLSSQAPLAPRQMPPSQAQRRNGPPPRPQRPDEIPRQAPRAPPASHQPVYQQPQRQQQPHRPAPPSQQLPSQLSHHGTGQWTGDGYGYAGLPSQSQNYPIAQHATYNKIPPRPPLGPPPSSRRGPSSYYSQMSPIHDPIVEEESARNSRMLLEEEAARNAEMNPDGHGFQFDHQSNTSLTSSNAIPIGIPKFYLDGRESGVSMSPSSEYTPAEESTPPRQEPPLRPFRQRMGEVSSSDDQHHEPPRPFRQRMLQQEMDNREVLAGRQQEPSQRQILQPHNDYFPPQPASSDRGESPSNAPVRKASLGKRSKPVLTTVQKMRKSSAASIEMAPTKPVGREGLPSQQKKAAPQETIAPAPRQAAVEPTEQHANAGADRPAPAYAQFDFDESPVAPPPPRSADLNSSRDSFLDSESESGSVHETSRMESPRATVPLESPKQSVHPVQSKEKLTAPKPPYQPRGRSPLARGEDDDHYDPLSKEMLEDPEKEGLKRQDSDTLKPPTAGFSGQRIGKRRPPRLDVDQVRDEEARGSLTSLSDLIKRATRVASNLDRGRTASRLGMEYWLTGAGANGNNNSSGELARKSHRSGGSMSDMLASFPPPGVATPTGNENRSLANWSNRRHSRPLPSNSDCASPNRPPPRKQRRCCGVPLWLFFLLLIILILLVAAAAIIPVVLIVLPNQDNDSPSASAQSETTNTQASMLSNKCATKLTCENGGQAFPTSENDEDEDTCRCVCTNSFTGSTCSSKSTAGCSSLSIPGMSDKATVGTAIPRLLDLAESSYDLDINARALLGLFNEADLSCAAENALVTFDGKAQKAKAKRSSAPAPVPSEILSAHHAEATTNGIVFDSAPSPSSASSEAAPSATASASSTSSTAAAAESSADSRVDFARAAVLYILQASSSMDEAEGAQKALQEGLDGGEGDVVRVGDWSIDLEGRKVEKK